MLIARKTFDFIIEQEVSSKAYYIRHYQHPEYPGGASGITVGIGYDLGYASANHITDDWSHLISPGMLRVMLSCAGVKGDAARALLPNVKAAILIPWDAAIEVFAKRDIPAWTAIVCKVLPNTDKISAQCLGVQVSIAYNRGAGGYTENGDRFNEMRFIRQHMSNCDFKPISGAIRSMARLWPGAKGLQNRRMAEAQLWDEGLSLPPIGSVLMAEPDPAIPLNAGPARTRPPATTPAQHGVAGAIIAVGVTAASHATNVGASPATVAAITVFAAVAAVAVWTAWYRHRNPNSSTGSDHGA